MEFLQYDLDEVFDSKSAISAILMAARELNGTEKDGAFFNEIYIWGTEEVGRRVVASAEQLGIRILGVFDSNPLKKGTKFMGFVVDEPKVVSVPVIICSYHMPQHLASASKLLGPYAISAWEFILSFRSHNHLPWNNLREPNLLTEEEVNNLEIIALRCAKDFQPEFWKQVAARHFVGICSTTNVPNSRASDEYFVPGIHNTTSKSIFLDLGAFTGDAVKRFFNLDIEGWRDERQAIAIEADRKNYKELLQVQNLYPSLIPLNAVISDKAGVIRFSEVEASMGSSALFFDTNTFLPAVTIDDIFELIEFTHSKFDIEGFERNALAGARKAISEGNALWSVASYHLWDDMWVLPTFFSNDYSIAVSSHAPLPWDTTLHFYRRP